MTPMTATNIETKVSAAAPEVDRGLSLIDPFGLGERKTYKQRIYQTLYELIQDMKIRPGARLVVT